VEAGLLTREELEKRVRGAFPFLALFEQDGSMTLEPARRVSMSVIAFAYGSGIHSVTRGGRTAPMDCLRTASQPW
jgi:hypothetical protein